MFNSSDQVKKLKYILHGHHMFKLEIIYFETTIKIKQQIDQNDKTLRTYVDTTFTLYHFIDQLLIKSKSGKYGFMPKNFMQNNNYFEDQFGCIKHNRFKK